MGRMPTCAAVVVLSEAPNTAGRNPKTRPNMGPNATIDSVAIVVSWNPVSQRSGGVIETIMVTAIPSDTRAKVDRPRYTATNTRSHIIEALKPATVAPETNQ